MSPTVTLEKTAPTLWSALPGWGIAADLIPPELINARRLRVLRRQIAAALFLLVIVCAGGFYLAARENTAATDDLALVQDDTLRLQSDAKQYAGVVRIQAAVAQIQSRLATLMAPDVDVVALLDSLRVSLPATMTITQQSITVSTAGVAAAAAQSGGLDTSGLPIIGEISLRGTGQSLDDLAAFVDRLKAVPGFVDVLPASNTATGADGTQLTTFSVSLQLTDVLLTHRFDLPR